MQNFCPSCMHPLQAGQTICPHCGQETVLEVAPHILRPGTILHGRYLVGRTLGQGGFGITYIGLDALLRARVAIKEYYPSGYTNRNNEVSNEITVTADTQTSFFQQGMDRFLNEARILARFKGEPGIVDVGDFFEENNTAYIVMEYLEGLTLKQYVQRKGPIAARTLFYLMQPVIQSLEKIHRQHVIHRDISPDNIMLLMTKELKLLDFGAAREVVGEKSLSVMLKPGYAPEEQYRSNGRQGPWTDVYALCATMYYCITGKVPEESAERIWSGYKNLPLPSTLDVAIEPWQEAALMWGLAVKAENRPQDMQILGNALYDPESEEAAQALQAMREILRSPKPQGKSNPSETPRKSKNKKREKRRKRKPVLAVLCVVLLLGALAAAVAARKLLAPAGQVPAAATEPAATAPAVSVTGEQIGSTAGTGPDLSGQDSAPAPQPAAQLSSEAETLYQTAVNYAEGVNTAYDWEKALDAFQKAADAGHPYAAAVLAAVQAFAGDGTADPDYAKAVEGFTTTAYAGDPYSMYRIGICCQNGRGTELNPEKGMEWLRAGADRGDAACMGQIGDSYTYQYYHYGVEQNYESAFEWLQKAANLGHVSSMTRLALLYAGGNGVPQDYAKALEWYRKAADFGDTDAMIGIGNLYADGNGVPQDDGTAMEWYTKAIDLKGADAMRKIGSDYESGRGVTKDSAKAMEWYLKAAELGDASAMYSIGLMYQHGRDDMNADPAKAMEWYLKAADLGNANAMFSIGNMYDSGRYGVEKDTALAKEWYLKAADLGNPTAMCFLGVLYNQEQNYGEALKWFQKAADAGSSNAMYYIGLLYETGQGVEQSDEKAFEWHLKAAMAGFESSMEKVAHFYENGQGVEQDAEKAAEWYRKIEGETPDANKLSRIAYSYESEGEYALAMEYRLKAAELGDAFSMYQIGSFYAEGKGVEQDPEKATEWYLRAFENGDTSALRGIAYIYLYGQGVEVDYDTGLAWYMKGAEAGDSFAMEKLASAYKMGSYGLEKNYAMALEWYLKAAEIEENESSSSLQNTTYYIGQLYEMGGYGIEKDGAKAIEWFTKAASLGSTNAMRELGHIFEHGDWYGVGQNYAKALEWYQKAFDAGYDEVVADIDRIHEMGYS